MNLTTEQTTFISSVLNKSPRIAVFDCDGTLWAGDSGAGFFYWELDRGLVAPDVVTHMRERYDGYRAGSVGEEEMCGEMVTMHAGLSEKVLRDAALEYFESNVSARIFPEMLELVGALRSAGCDVWAVSSTNNWVVEAGVDRFGIAADHVLAAAVKIANGCATSELIHVPSGEGKAVAIRKFINAAVDAVFGNSIHDAAMIALARDPYCINPTAELVAAARKNNWPIYWPAGTAPAA